MFEPSRSDARLLKQRAVSGVERPARAAPTIITVLGDIVKDGNTKVRERTSAARAVVQASRVELDAIRVAMEAEFENLSGRVTDLEATPDGELGWTSRRESDGWSSGGRSGEVTRASGTGTPRAARAGCRPASAGSTPGAGRPAAAGRRLADVAAADGPRVRQDAVARPSGSATGSRRGRSRRIALVGATAADVRDVMVEGPSGILAVCPPWVRPRYEPSKRRLTWPNGAVATTFSADEPDRLRGPQTDCAWLDELAAFRYPAAVGQPPLRPPPGRGPAALRDHDPQAGPPGDRPGGRPDDGDRPRDDLREPGPPGAVVLRADRDQVRGDPAGPAGAAGGGPRGLATGRGSRRSTRPAT